MSSLSSWEALLVDLLDSFQSTTSPLDTNFQGAVHQFKGIAESLLGGSEAFSGQAATVLQQAVLVCLSRDQTLIDANVLGQANNACTTFVQQINATTGRANGFVTDQPTLDEVLSAMSIFQAAQEGSGAIPSWIAQAIHTQQSKAAHDPDAALAAMNAQNTLQVLEGMADTIQSDTVLWEQALEGDVSEHAGLWTTIENWWDKADTLFEVLDHLIKNEKFKSFAEFIERDKGSYLAALALLLTVLADPPKNPDELMTDIYGSGLSWAAGLIPGVDVATLALEVIHQLGPALAAGQDAFAVQFAKGDPALREALESPAEVMRDGAEKIEVGSVFTDLGALLYDGSPLYSDLHGHSGRQAEFTDLHNLGHDAWSVGDGVWRFSTGLVGTGLDDLTTLAVPKNDRIVVEPVVHFINTGTNWVASLPDKLKDLGVLSFL